MLGPPTNSRFTRFPQPISWPGSQRPQLLRPRLLQRPRPQRRHLPDHRPRDYPNLGVKDAFVLVRRGDTQTAVHFSDGIDSDRLNQHVLGYRVEVARAAARAPDDDRGDRGHRRRPDLERAVRRRSRSSAHVLRTRHARHPRRAAVRPGGQLERCHRDRRRGDRRRPRGVDRQPRPVMGHPADRRTRARGPARPTRRSRACGGCMCRWRSTTSRYA